MKKKTRYGSAHATRSRQGETDGGQKEIKDHLVWFENKSTDAYVCSISLKKCHFELSSMSKIQNSKMWHITRSIKEAEESWVTSNWKVSPGWPGISGDPEPSAWTLQPAPWTWADCRHRSSSLKHIQHSHLNHLIQHTWKQTFSPWPDKFRFVSVRRPCQKRWISWTGLKTFWLHIFDH